MAKQTRKITLLINDKEETFFSNFSPAKNIFKAQKLFSRLEAEPEKEMEVIEEILDFIAKDVYNAEFTKDDILEGIDSADFMEELQIQLMLVMTRDVEGLKKQALQAQQ
ncbi:MAG TPA: hypothetical protein DEB42_00575 [Jeotgalicoccus sp.]|nr:hypothetical protein [Jeotgalicoccus sp.]